MNEDLEPDKAHWEADDNEEFFPRELDCPNWEMFPADYDIAAAKVITVDDSPQVSPKSGSIAKADNSPHAPEDAENAETPKTVSSYMARYVPLVYEMLMMR